MFSTQDHPLGHQEESPGNAALHKEVSIFFFRTFFQVFDAHSERIGACFPRLP